MQYSHYSLINYLFNLIIMSYNVPVSHLDPVHPFMQQHFFVGLHIPPFRQVGEHTAGDSIFKERNEETNARLVNIITITLTLSNIL